MTKVGGLSMQKGLSFDVDVLVVVILARGHLLWQTLPLPLPLLLRFLVLQLPSSLLAVLRRLRLLRLRLLRLRLAVNCVAREGRQIGRPSYARDGDP
jgi:hypothetical protein